MSAWQVSFGRRSFFGLSFAAIGGSLTSCKTGPASTDVVLFAAASLERAMTAIVEQYRHKTADLRVNMNFAGSNVLARQIESTEAADIFFSADEKWMDYLEARALIEPGTRTALLSNTLVIIARRDSSLKLPTPNDLVLANYTHLVLADPESVPAGRYAKQYLGSLVLGNDSLWTKLAPRVVPTLDVRAAVAAVAADPRRIGIVYASDLVGTGQVRALYKVPRDQGPRIVYPVALLANRPARRAASMLLAYLKSAEAAASYRKFGFIMI